MASEAITSQSSTPIGQMTEKKAYGSDRSCKAALIALGIICMIGGAVAAGVLYSHVGYISLICLSVALIGIVLIALSSRLKLAYQSPTIVLKALSGQYKPAHQSTTTLNHQQGTAGSDHSKSRDTSTEKNILETLTQQATRDAGAFLIDFSQVKPSNMFDIVKKGCCGDSCGAAAITDVIDTWCGPPPTSTFKFEYAITTVMDSSGHKRTNTFAMDSGGRVEFYSNVFPDFGAFLQHFMVNTRFRDTGGKLVELPNIDFTSPHNQTLRINKSRL